MGPLATGFGGEGGDGGGATRSARGWQHGVGTQECLADCASASTALDVELALETEAHTRRNPTAPRVIVLNPRSGIYHVAAAPAGDSPAGVR